MRRTLVMLGVATGVAIIFGVAITSAAGNGDGERGNATAQSAGPSRDERSARASLVELADAWMVGGGEFGFPFWDKAGRRWAAGQLTTTMYREYVTGYRDRLRSGCELLDAIDVKGSVPRDVPSLVRDSCSMRLRALDSQQRWLGALIELDARNSDDGGSGTRAVADDTASEDESLREAAVEHEQAYRAALQESYRNARRAMNEAQAWLDETGQERLAEDSII